MRDELSRVLDAIERIDGKVDEFREALGEKVDDLRQRTTRVEAEQRGLRDASEQRHGDNRLALHQLKEEVQGLGLAQASAATELRECRHDVRELKTASAAYLTARDMTGRDQRLEALEQSAKAASGGAVKLGAGAGGAASGLALFVEWAGRKLGWWP